MNDKFEDSIYKRTDVYLSSTRKRPKYMFELIGDKINKSLCGNNKYSLLDIGGAAGEFVFYLSERFANIDLTCIDADEELINNAKERNSRCEFIVGNAEDLNQLEKKIFDFVTMVGVMTIFDDFSISLSECLRVVKPGGKVFVVGMFNEYPVDALVRWRYSGKNTSYNRGYNLFSKKSVCDFLNSQNDVIQYEFEKFELPFDLPPQDDPIRSWTEYDAEGRRIFKNGLQMEINFQFLEISMKKNR